MSEGKAPHNEKVMCCVNSLWKCTEIWSWKEGSGDIYKMLCHSSYSHLTCIYQVPTMFQMQFPVRCRGIIVHKSGPQPSVSRATTEEGR
jgi:hypothetical protein